MSNVNFESGLFPSTSSTTDPVTGLIIGNRAVSAEFTAMEKTLFVGQGISRNPSISGLVMAKTGMTVTVKACKGIKAGYPFRLKVDKDITFTSSASKQVFYIGVRLVLGSYGWANYYDDDISYFGAFVSTTDLAFAKLTIPANAVTITDGMIEDLRDNPTYCGPIDQYLNSIQTILTQAQALYDAFFSGNGISATAIKAIWAGGAQTFTDEEKAQARANAGAASLTSGRITPSEANSAQTLYTASHTLALADAGRLLIENSASAIVVTIPTDASVAFPLGTEIEVCRWFTGAVSFAAESGVSLYAMNNAFSISGRFGSAVLKKVEVNGWLICGALG